MQSAVVEDGTDASAAGLRSATNRNLGSL
jgi:hypothetical protein